MSVFSTIDVLESPQFQKQVLQDHLQSVRRFRVDPRVARRFIKHNLDTISLHPEEEEPQEEPELSPVVPTVRRSLRIMVQQVTVQNTRSTFGIVAASDVWMRMWHPGFRLTFTEQGHQKRVNTTKQLQKQKRSAALQKLRNKGNRKTNWY